MKRPGPLLVTGGEGLLGREVTRAATEAGFDVRAFGRAELDITSADSLRRTFVALRPVAVIHCAALTNVDACEQDAGRAFAVNERGSANVATAAALVDADVVAVSTDYVFDGGKGAPYAEGDPTNPIQVYGRSKLAGEEAVRRATASHYIVRSAWIYGEGGKNFLSQLPALAAKGGPLKAVVDQHGSPTYAADLARAILDLAETGRYDTYHVVNTGYCTFADFCRFALDQTGERIELEETRVGDLGRPAPRPLDTRLDGVQWRAAGMPPLRPWTDAAAEFVKGSL